VIDFDPFSSQLYNKSIIAVDDVRRIWL